MFDSNNISQQRHCDIFCFWVGMCSKTAWSLPCPAVWSASAGYCEIYTNSEDLIARPWALERSISLSCQVLFQSSIRGRLIAFNVGKCGKAFSVQQGRNCVAAKVLGRKHERRRRRLSERMVSCSLQFLGKGWNAGGAANANAGWANRQTWVSSDLLRRRHRFCYWRVYLMALGFVLDVLYLLLTQGRLGHGNDRRTHAIDCQSPYSETHCHVETPFELAINKKPGCWNKFGPVVLG